jgi:hypothetical protein
MEKDVSFNAVLLSVWMHNAVLLSVWMHPSLEPEWLN